MAGNEPDKSEKTERATPFKLEEARRKGSVVKSMEVNTFAVVLAALVFLMAAGNAFLESTLSLAAEMLSAAGSLSFEPREFLDQTGTWVASGLSVLAPLVVLIMLVAVVTTLAQTGPVFTAVPIKPDIQRLNPVAGFKRLFSVKLIFETGKSLVKVCLFGVILVMSLYGLFGAMLEFFNIDPKLYLKIFQGAAETVIARLLPVLALFALLDWMFTRWDHGRNMRMTRKELNDELKRRDGDPMIRQRRRTLEGELRKRSESLGNVKDADLVVVNPTRFALVLKYDRSTMLAPQVVGKGSGEMARLIRDEAYRHRIPVIHSPAFARKLFKSNAIYSPILQVDYRVAAQLFRAAYRQTQGKDAVR
jgi:flagellar biosynthesis protein FlhB